ncbi:MAG: TSUP family transporter [Geodermatophilaceae bacterium]
MGLFVDAPLPALNAVKNVLVGLANLAAAVVFVLATDVAWAAAAAIAVGATIGGQFGPRIGRRLPPVVYRAAIVVVGVAVSLLLLLD